MSPSRFPARALGLALAVLLPFSPDLAAAPDAERQATLEHLLIQDCGSCHGLRMTGGLGPALTPQALAGKPRESLVATILHGRSGTAHGVGEDGALLVHTAGGMLPVTSSEISVRPVAATMP